ncbi:unnamed protein product [Didymodactylos carnosus]|uniref:Pericentriolar material 1 protein C-terminal domain-containing protein n=1 Tax=Didymodactylos carnosus TaxID=1234261 RepID=A0A8S2CQ32_9BILA|nr:unnamed protein product [Didymodactylos carnosus]CAF3556181.1 unnamed protein product [Didymodactylos carnosus]
MPLKRKIRNLPLDKWNNEQTSSFDSVYESSFLNNDTNDSDHGHEGDDDDENIDSIPRQRIIESNDALTAEELSNNNIDSNQTDQVSEAKIVSRIQQIQNSLEQAKSMLEPMEKMKDLIPSSSSHYLTSEQNEDFHNNMNPRQMLLQNSNNNTIICNSNEEIFENENGGDSFLLSRPRIESKIGFIPIMSNGEDRTNGYSDNEVRNSNSNYDSLIGSLKSDTLTWREQSTSDENESVDGNDKIDEKEVVRNLMLQKEQYRALQGRERALLALQKRSEQRLQEQRELLKNSKKLKKPTSSSKNVDAQNTTYTFERSLSNISGFEPIKDDGDDHIIENTRQQKQSKNISEKDLLYDITTLRNRLKLLRGLYDRKHRAELDILAKQEKEENKHIMSSQQQPKRQFSSRTNSYVSEQSVGSDHNFQDTKDAWIETARSRRINSANETKSKLKIKSETLSLSKKTNRLKELYHVKERLDELEQIINYYHSEANDMIDDDGDYDDDSDNEVEKEMVYEEQSIPSSEALKLNMLMTKPNKNQEAQNLDQLSDELNIKRMELMKAKTALTELQQLVKTIQPDESLSYRSTPVKQPTTNNDDFELCNDQFSYISPKDQTKTSLLSYVLSPKPEQTRSSVTSYTDTKMAAQHREIERLVESRQRLHTIKDQIASLHNSMNNQDNNTQTSTKKVDIHSPSNSSTKKDKFSDTLRSQMHHQLDMREEMLSKSRNMRNEINRNDVIETTQPLTIRRRIKNDKKRNIKHEGQLSPEWLSSEENTSTTTTEEHKQEKTDKQSYRIKQGNFHAPEDIVAETEHFDQTSNISNNSITNDLSQQMKEICHCLMNFIREQKTFNNTIEQNIRMIGTSLTPPGTSTSVDPVFQQLQQQVQTQGLIVNLNSAYREIAVLQSEINSLQSKNSRLSSSNQQDQAQQPQSMFQRDDSKDSIYSVGQIKIINNEPASIRYNRYKTDYDEQLSNGINIENSSNTPCNSQSTGKQTTIYVQNKNNEHLLNRNQTPTKHERNTMYTTEQFSSPKLTNYQSDYDTMNRHVHRRSSKDNIQTNQNKPFEIHQRPLSSTTDNKIDYGHQKKMSTDENRSPLSFDQFDEQKPRLSFNSFLSSHLQTRSYIDQNSDDDIIDQYRQYNENLHTPFSPTSMLYSNLTRKNISSSIFNVETKPSDLNNVDIQTLDLQIKSIMVHLIPYMRLHINEIFNLLILNDIKDRILFLSKQQPDSSQFVRNYQNQFSSVLTTTIAKYCGKTIRECTVDLIRDISELLFNELVLYKSYENSKLIETNKYHERHDDYIHSLSSTTQQQQSLNDEELDKNDGEYQIELDKSKSKPLILIGSNEEDNDADENNNDVEQPETAVFRQQANVKPL